MQLTEAELAALPEEWMRFQYKTLTSEFSMYQETYPVHQRLQTELIEGYARAVAPQPCGHPGACVVSAPYIDGVGESNSCAWCADQARRDEDYQSLSAEWRRISSERDALRNNLAALEGERGVLDALLNAAQAGLKVAGMNDDALREKLKAAERDRDDWEAIAESSSQ